MQDGQILILFKSVVTSWVVCNTEDMTESRGMAQHRFPPAGSGVSVFVVSLVCELALIDPFLKKIIYFYLAVPGCNCRMRDL